MCMFDVKKIAIKEYMVFIAYALYATGLWVEETQDQLNPYAPEYYLKRQCTKYLFDLAFISTLM